MVGNREYCATPPAAGEETRERGVRPSLAKPEPYTIFQKGWNISVWKGNRE